MANTHGKTYTIKQGDNFYLLAQRMGFNLADIIQANPGVDSTMLSIGQVINLPAAKPKKNPANPPAAASGQNSYADSPVEGESFSGRSMDHVGVNIGGVDFEVKRVIDNPVPHEIHIILPKTQVHTVIRNQDCTLTETQVMIDNMDIVHSPRQ